MLQFPDFNFLFVCVCVCALQAQQILESMNLEIDMTPQLERGQSNASSCDETIPLSPVSAF